MHMIKRIFLILISAMFACLLPLQALAAGEAPLGGTYEMSVHMEPSYFTEDHREMMTALAAGLDVLAFKGRLTAMGLEKFNITGTLAASGYEGVTYTVKGSERAIAIDSNLFGESTPVLMMLVWLEFWMKPYNFFEVPTQYAALLTSTYAHKSAWEPVIQLWNQYFSGAGSRTYTPTQCMEAAAALSAHMSESREVYYWLLASLGAVGGDSDILEFLSTLPDYVTQYAGEDGITVICQEGSETWLLGQEAFFTKVLSDNGWTWTLSLPAWNDYSLNAQWVFADSQELGSDIHFNAAITMEEESDPVLSLEATAIGLPNGQSTSGNSQVDIHMAGSLIDPGLTVALSGDWETTQLDDATMTNISLSLLDNGTRKPKLWTDIQFTSAQPEDVLNFTDEDIQLSSPDNVFTFNEITLGDFVSRVKEPFARTMVPMVLNMPSSFVTEIVTWLEDIGLLAMLMPEA